MRIHASTSALLGWSAPFALAALLAGCGAVGATSAMPPAALQSRASNDFGTVQEQIASGAFIPGCTHVVPGRFHCLTLGLRDFSRAPVSENAGGGSVSGWGPSQLQAAYNITAAANSNPGGLVALVEEGGDPNLESDLRAYRKHFGLPRCRKNRCVTVVNEYGQKKPLPFVNDDWLAEQSLDVDMVSANCPNCDILVVETEDNLYTAEKTAESFHPVAISNSWGDKEFSGEVQDVQTYFNDPGVAITAGAGDLGYEYGLIFPAAANTVTAVGGTSLYAAQGGRGYTETIWSGSGSGCSLYESTPAWQATIEQQLGGCSNRIVSDVAYVADPNTGVAVYETTASDGEPPGWQVWGGTSVGAPAIAAIYALSGNTSGVPASLAYSNPSALYDVTTGNNGSCSPAYLCTGEAGYDGPTGLGTPNGLGAF